MCKILQGLQMLVKIGSMAWFLKSAVSVEDLFLMKRRLTIMPRKTSEFSDPRPIVMWKEDGDLFGIPREYYFGLNRTGDDVKDCTSHGSPINPSLKPIVLRSYQERPTEVILEHLKNHYGCCFEGNTAFGKTVSSLEWIRRLGRTALVVVHKSTLAEQWLKRIKGDHNEKEEILRKGFLPEAKVGFVGGGKFDYKGCDIVIGMIQTLALQDIDEDFCNYFGTLVIDENHRAAAEKWGEVAPKINSRFRIGLSVGKDSLLTIRCRNGEWICRTIEKFYDSFNSVDEVVDIKKERYEIRSFNRKSGKFEWKRINSVIKHRCDKRAFRIVTDYNNEIVITEDHSVFKVTDGEYYWVNSQKKFFGIVKEEMGSNLNVGDYLAFECERVDSPKVDSIVDSFSFFGTDKFYISRPHIDLSGVQFTSKERWRYAHGKYGFYLPCGMIDDCEDGLVYYEGANGAWSKRFVDVSCLSYLMGFYLGNGWYLKNSICCAVKDALVDKFIKVVTDNSRGFFSPLLRVSPAKGKSKEIYLNNKVVKNIFESFFGDFKCHSKRVPDLCFSLDYESKRLLIEGLIDSDGHRSIKDRNRNRCYYTSTSRELAFRIRELIRSIGIPCGISYCDKTSGGVINGRKIIGKLPRYCVNFSLNHFYGVACKRRGKHHDISIEERKIKSVTQVSEEFVYDLSVDGNENFVANGFLVHNSATQRRKDGAEKVFFYHLGKIEHKVANKGMMKPDVYVVDTGFKIIDTPNFNPDELSKSRLLPYLVKSKTRTNKIVNEIMNAVKKKRRVLAVSDRIEHLETFIGLVKFIREKEGLDFTIGEFYRGDRKVTKEDFEEARGRDIIFGSYKMIEDGEDLKELDCLFMLTPCSDPQQLSGRILRESEGKKTPIVVDFWDDVARCRQMYLSRKKFYVKQGWKVFEVNRK